MTNDARLQSLVARAASLLPRSVRIAASLPTDPASLLEPERTAISRAIPARQREFAGGRAAAREAMRQVTGLPLPLPMGPDRAPLWPLGLRGSITHAAGICLTAVTDDPSVIGLGLDLEEDAPLPPDILQDVVLPDEHGQHSRLIFSAKETVFKALYPLTGVMFGFDAVTIIYTKQTFSAELRAPLGSFPAGTRLGGQSWRGDGLILTALAIQPSGR